MPVGVISSRIFFGKLDRNLDPALKAEAIPNQVKVCLAKRILELIVHRSRYDSNNKS